MEKNDSFFRDIGNENVNRKRGVVAEYLLWHYVQRYALSDKIRDFQGRIFGDSAMNTNGLVARYWWNGLIKYQ